MGAKLTGKATWIIEDDFKGSSEHEKKYREVLTELSKYVGAACNTGDVQAFQFLVNYTALIMKSGFEILKEVIGEEKSQSFQDFCKKVGVFNKS